MLYDGCMSYIYGMHAVQAALKNPKRYVKRMYCVESKKDAVQALCQKRKIPIQLVQKHELDKWLQDGIHQGVCVETEVLTCDFDSLSYVGIISKIMMLDQLQDVRNIGAIIRTAAAFGITHVLLSKTANCPNILQADLYAQLAKAAAGGLEHVNIIIIGNVAQALEKLKAQHYWIVGLDENGQDLSVLTQFEKICLVIGQEGEGLRNLTKKTCDVICSIPTQVNFGCLNASVAAAVGMFIISTKK